MASNELKAFLRSIDESYEQYADQLHDASFTMVIELAAASPELLELRAKVPIGAAGAIVKTAAAPAAAAANQALGRNTFNSRMVSVEESIDEKLEEMKQQMEEQAQQMKQKLEEQAHEIAALKQEGVVLFGHLKVH